ncbi:FAD-dependent oxidoreductase [Octadecabacter sp. 1_MG-2023]|uniref:NAD(P)/FAD-dependent oxidoreductase n=1 Tax=unclassified Octadecabacter TaxID=196158 RepID=UPI001C0963FE|nr:MULTISPECIES: FAD-dependent oxidoreductase [unclassified Octadecabacter]MBU2991846.1 FAD-binding oxidoreductase [Octadecabacter sp. B2R22]MDO6735820.1 FAD-dependent oxidoreductase [Octadecabacter sp. 1_MG-2023]
MIDFLVIGGGIAGVSVGARLSLLGSVTVLERESALAYHASGRSAAMFEECYGSPSTVALNTASKQHHFEAHGGVTSPRGILLIGTKDDGADFEADLKAMNLHDISLSDARAMLPILNDTVTRAGYHAEAWDLDTDRMVQNFASDIRATGGTVRTSAEVTGITRTGNGWEVTVGDDVLSAKNLVNAAGAWVDVVAQMAGIAPIGITPLRRSMARIPAPGGLDVSSWPMMFGTGENWYCKPDAGALIVSPAEEAPMPPMDAWADDMVLAEGLARYEAHVTEPVTRLLSNWAGLRSFSPDRNLVLGPDARDASFIWMAGQGGYGFQTAPAASQLVADLVADRQPDIPAGIIAKLSPERYLT